MVLVAAVGGDEIMKQFTAAKVSVIRSDKQQQARETSKRIVGIFRKERFLLLHCDIHNVNIFQSNWKIHTSYCKRYSVFSIKFLQ